MVQVNEFWDERMKKSAYHQPADYEKIKKIELNAKIMLPEYYISLMRMHDGGFVKKESFNYYDNSENSCTCGGIGMMLHIDGQVSSVYGLLKNPPEFFPDGLIPFADDGGGNLTCFDYRKTKKDPPIVFWVHDDPEGEDLHFVANNFEEFVNMLYEPEY